LVPAALLAERRDLLGEIIRARPAPCRTVLDVAMVEPFEVFVQPLVGRANERAQRRAGELPRALLDFCPQLSSIVAAENRYRWGSRLPRRSLARLDISGREALL
jgi:hypothetical protein